MATAVKAPPVSVQEYLERERAAETKSEYHNGEVIPMPGASFKHNLLVSAIIGLLYEQVLRQGCNICPSDMRVYSGDSYVYPDVVIVCGEPQLEDTHMDTLLNPTVLFEVLLPSTASYDRGDKFVRYRTLASLRDYVLVAQESVHVEHYARQGEQWLLSEHRALDDMLKLSGVDCSLHLSDLYERALFTAEPNEDE